MALPKKKVVKKVLKKKMAVADKAEPATKKKVVKKSAAAAKKKAVVEKKLVASKGKYPYEPYRAKKNVGNAAKNALLQGKDIDDTLGYVKEAFPECNISRASVSYYKSALVKEGYNYE